MSVGVVLRECARDSARVYRCALAAAAPARAAAAPMPEAVAKPGPGVQDALRAVVEHVLPRLTQAQLNGLSRFFSCSLRKAGLLDGNGLTPAAMVELARGSDAVARRLLAAAPYYLMPRVGNIGAGQPAPVVLLMQRPGEKK